MPGAKLLSVALKGDSVPVHIVLRVKELVLVPYSNPVSVTVPVVNEYEPDRVAPVWLIFITPSVVTVALGSSPPSPPTDGSHLYSTVIVLALH